MYSSYCNSDGSAIQGNDNENKKEVMMNGFDITELTAIKEPYVPLTRIKRQLVALLDYSCDCSAHVELAEAKTGKYRIVLEGQVGEAENLDSSYYLG